MVSKIYQRIHQIMVEERSRQVQLQISSLQGTITAKKKDRVELGRMKDAYGSSLGSTSKSRRQEEIADLSLVIVQLEADLEKLEDQNPL
jgi:hypothetical protein